MLLRAWVYIFYTFVLCWCKMFKLLISSSIIIHSNKHQHGIFINIAKKQIFMLIVINFIQVRILSTVLWWLLILSPYHYRDTADYKSCGRLIQNIISHQCPSIFLKYLMVEEIFCDKFEDSGRTRYHLII